MRSDDEPVHVFNEPGIYDVTLYVTGYEGSEVEAQTAVVEVPHGKAAFSQPQPRHGARTARLFRTFSRRGLYVDFETGPQAKKPSPCTNTRWRACDVTLTASNGFVPNNLRLARSSPSRRRRHDALPERVHPQLDWFFWRYYDPAGYDNDVFRPCMPAWKRTN